jgi:hypothetical protein
MDYHCPVQLAALSHCPTRNLSHCCRYFETPAQFCTCTCSDNELPDSGVALFFTEAMYLRLHLKKCLPFLQHQLRLTEHSSCWGMKNQLDVTCYILFHLLCAQHVSDINISIFRSLRLCWWITTSVVLFSVRCVLELLLRLIFGGVRFSGWSSPQNEHHQIPTAAKAPTHNELRTRRRMW